MQGLSAYARVVVLVALVALGILSVADAVADTYTWDGGHGSSFEWSKKQNWTPEDNNRPAAGDDLVFAGTNKLSNNNDITADTSFASITFNNTAGAFILAGNRITLGGDITNDDADLQTISLNMILSGNRTVNTAAGNVTLGGIISETGGAASLAKTGAHTLTLSGNNTYTGTTTITAGTLSAENIVVTGGSSNLGNVSSAVVLGGAATQGTLSYTGSSANYVRGFTVQAGGGEVDVTTAGQTLTIGTVGIDTSSGGNLTIGGAGNTSITAAIGGGGGGLTKTGAGTLTLSNSSNSYTGLTDVQAGTLLYGASSVISSGAVRVSGGTLDLAGYSDTVGAVTLTSGSINGSGTLTGTSYALQGGTVNANLGTGTVNVSTGTTTLNGTAAGTTVNIGSGTLALGASDRLADGAAVAVSGGALGMGSHNDTVGAFGMTSGSLDGTGKLTAATYGLAGGTVNANLGTGTLTSGLGNVALNGTADVGAVNVIGGTLTLGSGSRFTSSPAVDVVAGTVVLGGNEAIGSLTGGGGVDLGANTLTTGSANTSTAFSGSLSGAGGSLVKTGSGVFTLSGTNTFSGTSDVQQGTLLVDGSLGSAGVTVESGATLGGSGSIGGTTSIYGVHTPGNSPGLETFGDLVYYDGSSVEWELVANTDLSSDRGFLYDAIDVTGTLTVYDTTTMNLVLNSNSLVDYSDPFWSVNHLWQFYSVDGTTSGSFTLGSVSTDKDGDLLTFWHPTATFGIQQIGQDVYINYDAAYVVPEPSSLLFIGLSGTLMLLRRRRRQALA
jgi:fibronectin-binding autotransporter adhesin